jgi:hypothetical protein
MIAHKDFGHQAMRSNNQSHTFRRIGMSFDKQSHCHADDRVGLFSILANLSA